MGRIRARYLGSEKKAWENGIVEREAWDERGREGCGWVTLNDTRNVLISQ